MQFCTLESTKNGCFSMLQHSIAKKSSYGRMIFRRVCYNLHFIHHCHTWVFRQQETGFFFVLTCRDTDIERSKSAVKKWCKTPPLSLLTPQSRKKVPKTPCIQICLITPSVAYSPFGSLGGRSKIRTISTSWLLEFWNFCGTFFFSFSIQEFFCIHSKFRIRVFCSYLYLAYIT